MKKEKPSYNGIVFDSDEEREVYWWAEEAKQAGLIDDFAYQSPTFDLCGSVWSETPRIGKGGRVLKPQRRQLLKAATYTCDFHFTGKFAGIVPEYIDVKPSYEPNDARLRIFELKRKWVYQRYGVFVEAVKVLDLFAATFAPELAILSPVQKKVRKAYAGFLRVNEFVRRFTLSDIVSVKGE